MNKNPLVTVLCLLALAAPLSSSLAADHSHHHHGAATPTLQLNQGQKWATDAPLRDGMSRIQAAMEPRLAEIHGNRLNRAGYAKLAAGLEREVGGIVAACKLAPEADAMLHLVLADLGAGIEAMAGKSKGGDPRRGAAKVLGALEDYGRYFDHPGWKPMAH